MICLAMKMLIKLQSSQFFTAEYFKDSYKRNKNIRFDREILKERNNNNQTSVALK